MNDLVWYGRLGVWAGVVVLFIQAFTGRAIGLVTVLAVICLSAGLLAFLGGLMFPALIGTDTNVDADAPSADVSSAGNATEPGGQA